MISVFTEMNMINFIDDNVIKGQLTRWLLAYGIFVVRFQPKKTAVFGCLTNTLAPPPIALESCSTAQTDRPV